MDIDIAKLDLEEWVAKLLSLEGHPKKCMVSVELDDGLEDAEVAIEIHALDTERGIRAIAGIFESKGESKKKEWITLGRINKRAKESVKSAHIASCARWVDLENAHLDGGGIGYSGDVALVEVLSDNQKYNMLELENGEMVKLAPGKKFVGVLGCRMATSGITGHIPSDGLPSGSIANILNMGGVVGVATSSSVEVGVPINVRIIGFLENEKGKKNIMDLAPIKPSPKMTCNAPIIFVVGSAMNAGKTGIAVALVKQAKALGLNVGAAKLNGVALMRDALKMKEAGADIALTFMDVGLTSTIGDSQIVVHAANGVLNQLGQSGVDVIIAELGAGLIDHYNVKELLADSEIKNACTGVFLAAKDVMGASGCMSVLKGMGYEVFAVLGPATDTQAGKSLIEKYLHIHALNIFSDCDAEKIQELVKGAVAEKVRAN